jgi:hypothetical protein
MTCAPCTTERRTDWPSSDCVTAAVILVPSSPAPLGSGNATSAVAKTPKLDTMRRLRSTLPMLVEDLFLLFLSLSSPDVSSLSIHLVAGSSGRRDQQALDDRSFRTAAVRFCATHPETEPRCCCQSHSTTRIDRRAAVVAGDGLLLRPAIIPPDLCVSFLQWAISNLMWV